MINKIPDYISCIFCDSYGCLEFKQTESNGHWFIQCNFCDARGREHYKKHSAILEWQKIVDILEAINGL